MIGEVIWHSRARGLGFLQPDGGTEDLLVHRKALENARYLVPGEVVQFQIGDHEGRPCAVRVYVERDGGRDDE